MSNNNNPNPKKQKKTSDDEVIIKPKKVKIERKPPKPKSQFQKLLKVAELSTTPITAYTVFVKKKWEELKSQHDSTQPPVSFTEHSKLLSTQWKNMTEDEKAPFGYESNLKEKERLYQLANIKARHLGKEVEDTRTEGAQEEPEETHQEEQHDEEGEQEQEAQPEPVPQVQEPAEESPLKLHKPPKQQGSVQKTSKQLKLGQSPFNAAASFARQSLGGKNK